jgi:hypothetical protein
MFFFAKTLCANMECPYIHFFYILKYVFGQWVLPLWVKVDIRHQLSLPCHKEYLKQSLCIFSGTNYLIKQSLYVVGYSYLTNVAYFIPSASLYKWSVYFELLISPSVWQTKRALHAIKKSYHWTHIRKKQQWYNSSTRVSCTIRDTYCQNKIMKNEDTL